MLLGQSLHQDTDETSLELGVAKKRVLAQKGTEVLYNIISSTRDHITAALTVNAAGEMAPPCCFLWGVHNIAAKHLAGLSKGREIWVMRLIIHSK